MAQQLRLKSQRYSAKEEVAYSVDVLVDTGVPHLSKPFSYAVSEKIGVLEIGSLVIVPFSGKNLLGLVIKIQPRTTDALKFVKKAVHRNPIVNEEQIELLQEATKRWTGNFWHFLKFVIPTIPAKLQINGLIESGVIRKINSPELRIGSNYFDLIDLVNSRVNPARQLLIVLPEIREIEFLRRTFGKKFTEYGSHLTQLERAENYLSIRSGSVDFIVGTRSAIFLPLKSDAEIIVVDDLSFSFYESRYPYWNVRDIALMRAKYHSLTFYCHSPSLELVRLAESGWLKLRQRKQPRPNIHFSDGKISYQTVVKSGLQRGAVLILVPDRGYVNTLVCAVCRNLYLCPNCSGRLVRESKGGKAKCQICLLQAQTTICRFCKSNRILEFGKGVDKTVEEIGKIFPSHPINKIEGGIRAINDGQIVVSTYKNFPIYEFKAVALFGVEKFAYQNKLRSSEIARKTLFDLRALGATDFYLDIGVQDYFAQVFLSNDPYKKALTELADRTVAGLPPEFRIVKIQCDPKAISAFQTQNSVSSVTYNDGVAIVTTPVGKSAEFILFLQEIMNYRSMRKLKPWNVKVDPLDI